MPQNPLWGHYLWNAGIITSKYLETHAERLVKARSVLELGAGGGLPSLTAAVRGASLVLVTDYPDPPLVKNLEVNAEMLKKTHGDVKIEVEGYLWGADTEVLKKHLPESEKEEGFDTLILSDLLFNHSEHDKLVETVTKMMKKSKDARALVFFTPHRPWLYDNDLAFFPKTEEVGITVEKVLEEKMEKPMFEEDRGVSFFGVSRWKRVDTDILWEH